LSSWQKLLILRPFWLYFEGSSFGGVFSGGGGLSLDEYPMVGVHYLPIGGYSI
jgi:hypothetical protein